MADDTDRPAHARESAVLRLPGVATLDDLSPAWAWGGATGRGVRVAVVDSGIDANHPLLGDCVEVDDGVVITIGEDGEPEVKHGPHGDVFGHGTACAGIIHSFAPEARITSVRVLGAGLTGRAAGFLRGLGWAIEQGFDVINLSLGTSRRDWALPFHELCDEAYFRNCFVVTAANNIERVSFPSLYAAVTSVACNLTADPWRFHYNPEPPTEFLARGIDVEVPWLDGGTTITTGNSFAAPHIAGLATLIKGKHPQLRPFQIKTVLWATAANVREAPTMAGRLSRTIRRSTVSARASGALRPS
jgi:subtilisin